MRRSFGFIQYDNHASANAAIAAENGRLIGGVRLGAPCVAQEPVFIFSDMSIADNRDRNEGRKKALERKRQERDDHDTRPKYDSVSSRPVNQSK